MYNVVCLSVPHSGFKPELICPFRCFGFQKKPAVSIAYTSKGCYEMEKLEKQRRNTTNKKLKCVDPTSYAVFKKQMGEEMEKEKEKKIMMAKFGTIGMNGIVEQNTNNQAKTM
eukprot:g76754.t1